GASGLKVSDIILGCTVFRSPDWFNWVQDEEESISQIKAAYVTIFHEYSNGQSEVLGKAIEGHNFFYGTKLLFSRDMNEPIDGKAAAYADSIGYVNQYGLSRKHILDSAKEKEPRASAAGLCDVLHCHGFDTAIPVCETIQALHDVVKAGYIRYISRIPCYDIAAKKKSRNAEVMHPPDYTLNNHLTPFILIMQNDYDLLYREDENEMLPTLKLYFGVASVPWSALAHGAVVMPLSR
ncbi:NADP-dependent oxidoreductase domain-containing protein, partial [Armillaria nabsnona]